MIEHRPFGGQTFETGCCPPIISIDTHLVRRRAVDDVEDDVRESSRTAPCAGTRNCGRRPERDGSRPLAFGLEAELNGFPGKTGEIHRLLLPARFISVSLLEQNFSDVPPRSNAHSE